MVKPMIFSRSFKLSAAIVLSLGISAASASNLSTLAIKCSRQNGDSCSKLEKELEHCKKSAECIASLSPLPDSVLAEISAEQGIDQVIRSQADSILAKRKQVRDARALRSSNFQKLKVGMSVAEVESTIGPINPTLKNMANNAASPEMKAIYEVETGEMHVLFTDTGWSQNIGGGNPKNSTYSFEGIEYRLVFDYEGKLKEFQYRSAN